MLSCSHGDQDINSSTEVEAEHSPVERIFFIFLSHRLFLAAGCQTLADGSVCVLSARHDEASRATSLLSRVGFECSQR